MLIGIAALVIVAGYIAFLKFLVFPPLVPCLVAFGCAGLLGLLQRSMTASARLDTNIEELALSGDLLAPAGPGIPGPVSLGQRRSGFAGPRLAAEGPGMEGPHAERTECPAAGPRQIHQLRPAFD